MATFKDKFRISAGSSVLFYGLNDTRVMALLDVSPSVKPIVQAIVFMAVTFMTMNGSVVATKRKMDRSLYAALIFYFVSSGPVKNLAGTLLIQTIVYCCFLIAIMYL